MRHVDHHASMPPTGVRWGISTPDCLRSVALEIREFCCVEGPYNTLYTPRAPEVHRWCMRGFQLESSIEGLIPAKCLWSYMETNPPCRISTNTEGLVLEISALAPKIWLASAGFVLILGYIWNFLGADEVQHWGPWEKDFYRCKRVLLINFSPQKIFKKIFRGQIFSHAGCREVVSGTVYSGD